MDIIIRNARISDKESLKDVAIKDGKIIKIEENMAEKASEEIDADGRVLIPGLVESHIHMDKALIADRLPNRSGTLAEAIKVTAELKQQKHGFYAPVTFDPLRNKQKAKSKEVPTRPGRQVL